ncbi:MAG: hypothetical protein O7C59_11615 [Rickettsia endosymbiont of Ixodes persulcatus]|nr:hypothetical protein [Rickettsia endosymbiont of Ixodes persulcatus]
MLLVVVLMRMIRIFVCVSYCVINAVFLTSVSFSGDDDGRIAWVAALIALMMGIGGMSWWVLLVEVS